jgi:hypothetical protein
MIVVAEAASPAGIQQVWSRASTLATDDSRSLVVAEQCPCLHGQLDLDWRGLGVCSAVHALDEKVGTQRNMHNRRMRVRFGPVGTVMGGRRACCSPGAAASPWAAP